MAFQNQDWHRQSLDFNCILQFTGGYSDGHGDTDSILKFDTTKLEWTLIGRMRHKRRLHGLGVVLMNDIIDDCKYAAAPDSELFMLGSRIIDQG